MSTPALMEPPVMPFPERIAFWEEISPRQHCRVSVRGPIDRLLLDALETFIARQRQRIAEAEVAAAESKLASSERPEGTPNPSGETP